MKKRLNVDLIQSELRGGSAFFPGYKGTGSRAVSSEASDHEVASQPGAESKSQAIGPKAADAIDDSINNKQSEPTPIKQGVPPPVPRTVPRTYPSSNKLVQKVKRPMKQRQPFDIYEDQYARLKQIADAERSFVNGRGMSQMVREAIDAYLAIEKSPNKK